MLSSIGEYICGDLDKLGWVVLRGLSMRQETYDAINQVSNKGKGNNVTWTSIETAEYNRKMIYKTSTTATIAWKKDTLLLYLPSDIK